MQLSGKRGAGGVYDILYNYNTFKFPSVTTILSSLKDPDLISLRSNMSTEEFDKISKNAADRGSVMHMFLENYAKALLYSNDKDKSLAYSQIKTPEEFKDLDKKIFEKGRDFFYNIYHSIFLQEFTKPLLIEGLMVSFEYKYAGRTDIIYLNESNEIVLGDYKSSSNILEPHSNKVIKYKLQLAAYINAFEELYNKEIKEGVIWVANPMGFQKFILTKYEYPIYLNYFKQIILNYETNKKTNI